MDTDYELKAQALLSNMGFKFIVRPNHTRHYDFTAIHKNMKPVIIEAKSMPTLELTTLATEFKRGLPVFLIANDLQGNCCLFKLLRTHLTKRCGTNIFNRAFRTWKKSRRERRRKA